MNGEPVIPLEPDTGTGAIGFLDNRPEVASFIDLMTAAMEGLMAQRYLDRLQFEHGEVAW